MNRRNGLIIAGIALAAAIAVWWAAQRPPQIWRQALHAREAAARVLGEYLLKAYPDGKFLVFGNPFAERSGQAYEVYAFQKWALRGLELGAERRASVHLVVPELKSEFLQNPESVFVDPRSTTPLSYLVSEKSFDRLVAANPDYQVLISLIGLPVDVTKNQVWNDSRTHFGLLLPDWRSIGSREAVMAAIRSEKVAAAVLAKPGVSVDEGSALLDYRRVFDESFILVTKDNVDDVLRRFPQLF